MFRVGSSRITVCGQAPVSTAATRSGSISPRAAQPLGILLGDEIVGDDRKIDVPRCNAGISRSTSAVLPEPTGPPMPTARPAGRRSATP